MTNKVYPFNKVDIFGLISTLITLFITIRLGAFNGFNFGFTIGFVALLIAGASYIFSKKCNDKIFSTLLFICIIALCFGFSVISNSFIKFLSFIYLIFICTVFFTNLSANNNCDGSYTYILNSIKKTFASVFDNFLLPFRSMKESAKGGKAKNILQLLIGFGISIPVLCAIIPLLTSSDIAFGTLVSSLFENSILIILALILSIILTPVFFAFLFSLKKEDQINNNAKNIPDKISKVILNTVLGTTSIVYIAYVISQLAYISKAFSFLLPENYSAAQFARSGFFQMGVIAFINFVILFICAVFVTKTESKKIPASTRVLLSFLCLFTVFYISTAFVKMMKYISLYGLTQLRVLTSVFMMMLAIIFVILLIKLIFTRLKYIKAIILVCTLTMISISVIDINTVIANYNYKAYKEGKISIDVEQIGNLGVSGLPVLVKLSEEKPLEENYDVVYEIVHNAYSIYDMGIDSLEECTDERLVKKSVFEKNYTWEQAKIALDKFIRDNPGFDRDEYFLKFADDEFIGYDDYVYDEEYHFEEDLTEENTEEFETEIITTETTQIYI